MAQYFDGGSALHFLAEALLAVSFLLISLSVWAQDGNRLNDSDLLARLSLERSGIVQEGGVRHVCVAVSRDGDYRIVRTDYLGQALRLHGKMPKEQLQQLTKLLEAAEFRALSGYHGGLIRQDAESFGEEIPGVTGEPSDATQQWIEPDVWRLHWLNADGESPFPGSVAKVVDWLRQFQPKGGESFSYAEFPDVCPSSGFRLLHPAVAENQQP
jgi:hypothetical protein